jgi:branched-chain amino acid transport system permease protein
VSSGSDTAQTSFAPHDVAMPRRVAITEKATIAWGRYALVMAVALTALPFSMHSTYWLGIVTFSYLMAALAASWNIIGGFGGQFSLGHGIFFATGAYVAAILFMEAGVSPWISLFLAAALSSVVAVAISWLTFRLKGPFFTIATMAFSQVAFVIVNYIDWPTGGPRGILIPFQAGFTNMIFAQRWKWALLMFAFLAIVMAITVALRRSRFGFYLLATHDDEDTARACGVDVLAVRLKAMALSAALTSVGGTLFAMYFRFIDPPSVLGLADIGVKLPLLALIGGIGTVYGPMLGAALIIPLENYLRVNYGGVWPGAHLAILGVIMVLAAIFMRKGIVGLVARLRARWIR